MTLAYGGTIYVAHHARTTSLWDRLTATLRRHRGTPAHRPNGTVVHVGITEELPVLDPEPIADPLDGRWQPFEPDRVPAHTYDELAAATPVSLDWQPPSFTESWNAAGLRERLAAEDAAAEGGVK
jgi:hypothetical protein